MQNNNQKKILNPQKYLYPYQKKKQTQSIKILNPLIFLRFNFILVLRLRKGEKLLINNQSVTGNELQKCLLILNLLINHLLTFILLRTPQEPVEFQKIIINYLGQFINQLNLSILEY
ncbi:hypothetical protein pb186bvf_020930 [Paramecium bursaria]